MKRIENTLAKIGGSAKKASSYLANVSTAAKNSALVGMSKMLVAKKDKILKANMIDVENARKNGMAAAFIDRLTLNEKRINEMAEGARQVASLPDPVGEIISAWKRPNGLRISQQRVPIGVIGMIYESRPNVTLDSAALCIKSGNAVILKGGSEAINSNKAIVSIIKKALQKEGLPGGSVQLIEDTSREAASGMMKMDEYIDVLIPRGGAGLINAVVQNSTIPVIRTGAGKCHVYVDGEADLEMGERIIINAKTSKPSACNAAETLLVDEKIAPRFIPKALKSLEKAGVEIRGCRKTRVLFKSAKPATEDDWYREYLDYILAVKIVKGIDEAIAHINKYGTKHSEAIVTSNQERAQRFLNEVDAAAVYVNASTRFTDGFEFGFGAEIGISNQKLHARGPIGLKELTTVKYIIHGTGQTR